MEKKIKFNISRPIWLLISVQCQLNTVNWDTFFPKLTAQLKFPKNSNSIYVYIFIFI
ncbi:mCG1049285 [Mus musculus]|nr:mCG1049285 [Mus musculus]